MFEFLDLLAAHRPQVKAFAELLGHLVEGALRHPSCDAEWFLAEIADLTARLVVSTAGEDSPYPPLARMRQTKIAAIGNALAQSVQRGVELAARPDQRRAVKLDALKCTVTPHLVFDGNVPEPEATAIAQVEPSHLPESSQPKASTTEVQTVHVVREERGAGVVEQVPGLAQDLVARTSHSVPIEPAGP